MSQQQTMPMMEISWTKFMAAAIMLTVISQQILMVEAFVNPSSDSLYHVSGIMNKEARQQFYRTTTATTIISPLERLYPIRSRTMALEVSGAISSRSEKASSDSEEGSIKKKIWNLSSIKQGTNSTTSSLESSNRPNTDDGVTAEVSKFRTLKDFMWKRDTLEDLAAAEFACSVETADDSDGEEDGTSSSGTKRRRRAVDYGKLVTNLNKRIQDILGGRKYIDEDGRAVSGQPLSIVKGRGMGRVVYTEDQRTELLT